MKPSLFILGMVFSMTTTACDSEGLEPPESAVSVEESLKATEGAIEVLASVAEAEGMPPSADDLNQDIARITEQLERMSLKREKVHEELGSQAASDLVANHVQANLLLKRARRDSEAVLRYLYAEEPDMHLAAYRWKKRLKLKALAEDLR